MIVRADYRGEVACWLREIGGEQTEVVFGVRLACECISGTGQFGLLTFVAFLLACNEVMTAEVGESIISIVRASSYTLCTTSQDSIVFRNHLIPLHRQSGPNICSQIYR